jgi:hypothetical protein
MTASRAKFGHGGHVSPSGAKHEQNTVNVSDDLTTNIPKMMREMVRMMIVAGFTVTKSELSIT